MRPPTRQVIARWRELGRDPGTLRPLSVGIAASYTVEPLLPFLGVALAGRGLFADFRVAPFNQIYQTLLAPPSPRPAITLVLPRLEDLCARELSLLATLDPAAVEEARAGCRAEIDRLAAALAAHGGSVVCGNFAAPPHRPLGPLDATHAASLGALRAELNLRLWQQARGGRFALLDVEHAVAGHGAARAHDARMWRLSRCPYSMDFLAELAEATARTLVPLVAAPAKVVVVDLDNTLWGGTIGEDGLGGIALGDGGLGDAFSDFQEALLALRAQGVLLCVASKNNEADAWEVFDQHAGMRLRRAHLAAWRIGWQRKSEALAELSRELSLGLDSFVFLDDNPTEREEVRQLLPQVTVVDLPPDPADFVAALRAVPRLDRMVVTAEDRARADQVRAERSRDELRETHGDLDAFLRSLGLVVTVRRAAAHDAARVAQLTQKTNQFNLTTVRRTAGEVEALLAHADRRVYVLEVHDRFGEYGLTGVAVAARAAADAATWDLDTLLLSCRVLGRGVETAFLGALAADLEAAGCDRLTGRFLPTEKNAPARDFLPRHGFVAAGDGWVRAPLAAGGLRAPHIVVNR